jgi:hypothetical protein
VEGIGFRPRESVIALFNAELLVVSIELPDLKKFLVIFPSKIKFLNDQVIIT